MNLHSRLILTAMLLASSPAFAQFEKAQATMSNVQVGLYSLAAIAVTIAAMWIGFKMLFQSAHFKDLAHVFWGGLIIGSAGAIAGTLLA